MMIPVAEAGAITEHLRELAERSPEALARLAPLVYQHLLRLASGQMRGERGCHTLQPTALVHEVFLRLEAGITPGVRTRAQFYALAARVMRSILVDHARARATVKRGGGAVHSLTRPGALPAPAAPLEIESVLDIHNAIETLEASDPHLARLVEMRFFAGMTAEDAAAALDISVHTIRHDLRLAQAWLKKELTRTQN